jgi:hypothetical protein
MLTGILVNAMNLWISERKLSTITGELWIFTVLAAQMEGPPSRLRSDWKDKAVLRKELPGKGAALTLPPLNRLLP